MEPPDLRGGIGKVSILSAVVVLLASLGVYQAEHKTNHEFATVRDALGWGIVTLTTVGYGDDTDRRPG